MTECWRTRRARRVAAITSIVLGLPLAIVALDRAVRTVLDVGCLLLCVILWRDREGPGMDAMESSGNGCDGMRMKPGTSRSVTIAER